MMQPHRLASHPAHPPVRITRVEAKVIARDAAWLRLRWRIEGSQALVVPPFAGKGRATGLWKTSCFEAFLQPNGGESYLELNLSPSERWAAYAFDSYRAGMRDQAMTREPVCTLRRGSSMAIFDAAIPAADLPAQDYALGLSCILEEEGGTLSYWALAHPADKPDFHAAACFTARLAAPDMP